MRKLVSAAVTAAAVLVTPMFAPAFADVPGRGWVSAARVTDMLAKRGYRVNKIEADDGRWEGEAVRAGRKFEFHASPTDGTITKLKRK